MTDDISSSYSGGEYASRSRGGNDATKGQASVVHAQKTIPSPFYVSSEAGTRVINDGTVYCGKHEISVSGINLPSSGTVYLVITCTDGEYSGELTTTVPSEAANVVYRKLYDVEDSKVVMDYRLAPVLPVYS